MSTCKVTIDDGTIAVVIENVPEQAISFAPIGGGGSILRFRDGTAKKQQSWYKEAITVTGEDRVPKGLRDLLYDLQLTVTVVTAMGTDVYTGFSEGVIEDWGLTSGTVSWSITVEED